MTKYIAKSSNPLNLATDCMVVGAYQDGSLTDTAQLVDDKIGGFLSSAINQGDLNGDPGSALLIPGLQGSKANRVLLVGCGQRSTELSIADASKIASAIAGSLQKYRAKDAVIDIAGLSVDSHTQSESIAICVQNIEYSLYSFDQLKQKKSNKSLKSIIFLATDRSDANLAQFGIARGQALANGVKTARDLGNLPGNICTPTYLAKEARKLQKSHGLKVTILEEKKMEELGMGSLLSVSRGSREPAKFIIMQYSGGAKKDAPIVLVGKGLTFDAGGISLKPAGAMDEMKYDMCGGASVFGVMQAVAEMKLPVNLIGVVPSSENLPDGAANKPGDVVTSMAGKTIEILNTDAEGRLILCDALTYCRRFKPAKIIDIATLTGACVVALGAHPSGMFTHSDELSAELEEAGNHTLDRVWRMPLWDDYQNQIDTPFADIANVGGRNAGAVTAACFLARFTEGLNWAHLDIAGTAWTQGKNKSSTGRPVSLLTQLVINHAEK